MADPYEELLKKAYANITEIGPSAERFHIPEAKVYMEGKTTVIENFGDIAGYIRREPDHLMKYLVGELGTAGKIEGGRAVFNGKFEESVISSAIKNYVEDYVICSECGRPDTRLVKDDRILILRCDACGGHRPVRKRKARTEEPGSRLEEGAIVDVRIESISRRGDGVARIGKYIMYVSNARPGQTVKVKITRISGSIIFTERA
ncbi:MAG: translation initiation factor IF-2 subunit beta [Methanofollis sp.]|jgi:translation initiation factor 2 subunit 2|uniref:translation initiation factor IF-2 subunit beta n=1 Tax=Methanofollis TaxID=81416 RepID=UPI00082C9AB9|nr:MULTISPECIES: translation initiation factor IF-2 subunit beta [Methanofollis]MDD4254695.1 translation initiation factor IF-2 subunit beta [Methanofollis sp.]